MDQKRREHLEGNAVPETYREIIFQAISPKRFPQRSKVTDENDLKHLSLTPNELVDMLARELMKNNGAPEDVDIDTPLKGSTVTNILTGKPSLADFLRDKLAKNRQATIEEEARAMLRTDTTPEHPYTPEEAAAAVIKITWKKRNDLAGSFTRTSTECARVLTTLVQAYLDRTYGPLEQAPPALPEEEARLRGLATSKMFYRAVEPSIGDAAIASVIGPALEIIPSLDKRLRKSHNLTRQLASKDYLKAGQDQQLAAETTARRHFPFGLQQHSSLAVLTTAIYLLRAQCSDTIISTSLPIQGAAPSPEALFTHTADSLNQAVGQKLKADTSNGWHVQYSTTPGALDCLRVSAPQLSNAQVPAFLRVPNPTQAFPPGQDPAHRLIRAALPLDEQPNNSVKPWDQTHWNPFGQRLLHNVNREHYKRKNHPLFNEEEFKLVAVQHTTAVLTELIKLLQRAEGIAVGLPNTRGAYTHSSMLSLNNFLWVSSDRPFNTVFEKYRTSLDEQVIGPKPSKKTSDKPAPTGTSIPDNLPHIVVLLTRDSVRAAMEKNLLSLDRTQWLNTDQLSDPGTLNSESIRKAAIEMLEVANWSEINEALLRNMSLDEILTEYYLHSEALGNPSPEPDEVNILKEELFRLLLSDASTIRLLEPYVSGLDHADLPSEDIDHDR